MTLHKAVFITAYNRADYFYETMKSWRNVRGLEDWKIFVRLEPCDLTPRMKDIVTETEMEDVFHVTVNPQVYGVLHHPWVGFTNLFEYFDFVVRAEDDLLVSEDILEYFSWAAETYKDDQEIGAVLAFNSLSGDDSAVNRVEDFNPWVWGTWHDRWNTIMRDTWDHNYTSGGASDSGWDWNLKTRIFPARGLKSIRPESSRTQNIGEWGVHGTPQNLLTSPSFRADRPVTNYIER